MAIGNVYGPYLYLTVVCSCLTGLQCFSPFEDIVSKGVPPQCKAVEADTMEDERRWKELFDRLSKLEAYYNAISDRLLRKQFELNKQF